MGPLIFCFIYDNRQHCFKWLSLWLYSWKGLWTMFAITLEIERKESNSCLDHRNLWSDLCSYFAYALWQNHPGIYLYVFIPIALFPFSLPFVTKYWSLFLLITYPVSCGGLHLISEIICINHIYLFLEGQLYSLFCPSMVFLPPETAFLPFDVSWFVTLLLSMFHMQYDLTAH